MSVAVFGLVLAAPLMLVIAVLVKFTSKGSVFYTQPRVGVDRRRPAAEPSVTRRRFDDGGRRFTIYKFRTMAEGNGDAQVWAKPDDPRVTPLGRILRKYRLDEVPQLFNSAAVRHERGGPPTGAAEPLQGSSAQCRRLSGAPAGLARYHRLGAGQPAIRLVD